MPKIPRMQGWLLASLAVSPGGFLNGFETGSIGAVTAMPAFAETFGKLTPTMLGLVISTVMLAGGIPAVFAGRMAERWGVARVIGAGGLLFAAGAVLQASAVALGQFVAGRVLVGLGQGVMLANIVVYICEIAPSAWRGRLVTLVQLVVTVGMCAGFFTCYGSVGIAGSWSWRVPFIAQAVVALGLAAATALAPPSPRWLLSHGRRAEAELAIARLDIPAAEADKDMLQPFLRDMAEARRPGGSSSFWQIFAAPVRPRTCLALFLLAMVQLSGIDGVLYYAPLLFEQAGLSSGTAAFFASGMSAVAIAAVTVPAFLLADRWDRRSSMLVGGVAMAGCMFGLGTLYHTGAVASGGPGRWFAVALIYVFALLYAATWAMSAKLYAGEIQAPQTRLAANSVAQGVNFFTNFLVALFTPIFLARSSYGAYFLFGSLIALTVVVCALAMPETRGRSLEDINSTAFIGPGWIAVQRLATNLRSRFANHRAIRVARAATHPPTGVLHGSSDGLGGAASRSGARTGLSAIDEGDIELQDVGGLLSETDTGTAKDPKVEAVSTSTQ